MECCELLGRCATMRMVSAQDGRSVGYHADPQQQRPIQDIFWHHHGCQWQPFGDTLPKVRPDGVVMLNSDEGWATGWRNALNAIVNPGPGVLFHYSQGQWSIYAQ